MSTNLAAQAKLPNRPTFRQPALVTPFPTEADVRAFTLDFTNAPDAQAWLAAQGVGDRYSTGKVECDFLQCFARMYLVNSYLWQNRAGETFCDLMRDLAEAAQQAGAR